MESSGHLTDDIKNYMLSRIPGTRLGSPDDIAGMVAMLLSEDGRWINGQVFNVNGGALMR
jgi:NAD(P)-dependent dehydrogenase (short-subunit alcohol dehydrogenase family)